MNIPSLNDGKSLMSNFPLASSAFWATNESACTRESVSMRVAVNVPSGFW